MAFFQFFAAFFPMFITEKGHVFKAHYFFTKKIANLQIHILFTGENFDKISLLFFTKVHYFFNKITYFYNNFSNFLTNYYMTNSHTSLQKHIQFSKNSIVFLQNK